MKTPEMTAVLDRLSLAMFGRVRSDSMRERICVTCGGPANSFQDELSAREFLLSGMCQACQDSVFGEHLNWREGE